MPITLDKKNFRFTLKTDNTMYVMEMLYGKYPLHLYYGKKTIKKDFPNTNITMPFEAYYEAH